MPTLRETVDAELIRALVARQITCPRTGELLDVRTAVVIRDGDGDPVAVLAQSGYADTTNEERSDWRRAGLFVDHDTVTSSPFQVVATATYGTCAAHCDVHAFDADCVSWRDYPTATTTTTNTQEA